MNMPKKITYYKTPFMHVLMMKFYFELDKLYNDANQKGRDGTPHTHIYMYIYICGCSMQQMETEYLINW
jgi:hypothetical protein